MAKQSECDTGNLSLGINSMISILKQYAESKVKRDYVQHIMILDSSYFGMASTISDHRSMRCTQPRRALLQLHILPHSPSDAAHPSGGCLGEFIGAVSATTLENLIRHVQVSS